MSLKSLTSLVISGLFVSSLAYAAPSLAADNNTDNTPTMQSPADNAAPASNAPSAMPAPAENPPAAAPAAPAIPADNGASSNVAQPAVPADNGMQTPGNDNSQGNADDVTPDTATGDDDY